MARSWTLAVAATVYVLCGRAAALAQVRVDAPTEFPGPGSPPGVPWYPNSGHVAALPKAGPNAVPTANPAGQLYPPCTCAVPMPMPYAKPPMPRMAPPMPPPPPPTPGEVEVLTVDVHLANRVRCDNASLAADVAKILNIPVKRITVTPWSWTLPNPPQSTYLAFVQEDHERCDCKLDNGRVAHGQGFRKVEGHAASDGTMLDSGTSVMTVKEYKAMTQGASTKTSAGVSVANTTASGPRGPIEIPASRVQMLTRDPCLVDLLRTMTPEFKKQIAGKLGVPEDKVIIDPPPVKGTVGLLQLDSTVRSSEEARPLPILAVQHCSLGDLANLEQRLSLLDVSESDSDSQSPPNMSIAMNASNASHMPMVYSVAAPNVSNATDARVSLVMRLNNLNYELLAANLPLVQTFTSVAKAAIAEAAHIPPDAVKMAIWPGSTVLEVEIKPPDGTAAAAVLAFLNETVCNATVNKTEAVMPMDHLMGGEHLECVVLSLDLKKPPFATDESNRAWIAFWSVTLLPPIAQDTAWNLLNMVNDPGSQLSKLLPMTLARIPGLKYRGLAGPNLAIHEVNETRLPPPEDKAVGFGLPDPYDEEARIKEEQRRMKMENAQAAMRIKEKSALEQMKAQEALQSAQRAKLLIKQANAKFMNAARAHAQAMRPANASNGPDIVPFEVLADSHLGPESPYPWRDQMPPPRFMFNLVQEPQQETAPAQLHSEQRSPKRSAHSKSLLSRRALVAA